MTPEDAARMLVEKWFMAEPYMYGDRVPEVVADIVVAINTILERAAYMVEQSARGYDGQALAALDMAADLVRAVKGKTT